MSEHEIMNWADLGAGARDLAQAIHDDCYRPDMVLAVARGGLLVAGALAGTGELLRKRDPATIRDVVAPPGGATEAGLAHLEGVVEEAFLSAVSASLERFR